MIHLVHQQPQPAMNSLTTPHPGALSVSARRAIYLTVLTGLFTLFNAVRLVSYLPTIWAIHSSGDSSQHSLWTWGTWFGANLTMAAWLYEHNGQRIGRAVAVNLCSASMCGVTVVLIASQRSWI